MNELEQAILSEIQKHNFKDDALSIAARKQKREYGSLTKNLALIGLSAGFGIATYYVCHEIAGTEYQMLAIPASIWGLCGTIYPLRKIRL